MSIIAVYYDSNLLSPLWLKWCRRLIKRYNLNLYNETPFLVPGFRRLLHFVLGCKWRWIKCVPRELKALFRNMPQIANCSCCTHFVGVAVNGKITYHNDCHILKALIRALKTPYYFHCNCQQGCVIKGIQYCTEAHICALYAEFNLNILAIVSKFVKLCTFK